MRKRNWNRVRPTSLRHAMELCLEYAREKKNLSVDHVADLMGLPQKWTLYKWMESGRMPAILIRPFEHACGAEYMTRYLAGSAHKLVVDIPSGRKAQPAEVNELQGSFADAVGLLIKFYDGGAAAGDTLAALEQVIGGLAWHRENVAKAEAPELALFAGEGEA